MLFAKQDLRNEPGRSLGQRFAHHFGRYLIAPHDDHVEPIASLEVTDCYAFLGHNAENNDYDQDQLKRTIQSVIKEYHDKTGYWLNQEQVAFAAAWQDAKQQALIIHQRFEHLNVTDSILGYNNSISTLRLALIADALKITKISIPDSPPMPVKPSACRRTLNLPLDETDMPEIEAIGREVRENCEKAHTQQGVDVENLQTCWRLKLRYEGCKNSLMLKCMPIDMLRETFENLYLQKYGTSDANRVIIIDELEIEVGSSDDSSQEALKTSIYSEQWMNQWQAADKNQSGLLLKQENSATEKLFDWLNSSVLDEIMTRLIPKQTDSATLGFFLTIHQKGVDEVVTQN